jgi:NTP pyrophosphatase (non-canonical NTP hydrolase)
MFNLLYRKIGKWQEKTFPGSNYKTKFNHLLDEIVELGDSLDSGTIDEIKNELADCFILLLGICYVFGVRPVKIIRRKYKVNKKRKWGKPNEYGVISHVKE